MLNCRRRFAVAVELGCCGDRAVAEEPADHLVLAGIALVSEKQTRKRMAKQMGVKAHARVPQNGFRDLRSEKGLVLWAAVDTRKKRSVAVSRKTGAVLLD